MPFQAAFRPKAIKEHDKENLENVRLAWEEVAFILEDKVPNGRYKSIMITHLEIAAAMSTKAFSHESR